MILWIATRRSKEVLTRKNRKKARKKKAGSKSTLVVPPRSG